MPMAPNPTAAGTQPVTVAAASSLQPADKYSAIADLESVFSSTSIGSTGFGFQSVGVNWAGGGATAGGVGMWGAQATPYSSSDGTGHAVNVGHPMPQIFGVSNAPSSTATPPSYAAVAGNPHYVFIRSEIYVIISMLGRVLKPKPKVAFLSGANPAQPNLKFCSIYRE